MTKYSLLKLLDKIKYDWKCGAHSGIPACCRIWFITTRTITDNLTFKILYNHVNSYGGFGTTEIANKFKLRKIRIIRPGYVRCPACIYNNVVKEVKPCNCSWAKRKAKSNEHVY